MIGSQFGDKGNLAARAIQVAAGTPGPNDTMAMARFAAPRLLPAALVLVLGLCGYAATVDAIGVATQLIKFELDGLDGKPGNTGSFVLELHPEWAPKGAARMKEMVDANVQPRASTCSREHPH